MKLRVWIAGAALAAALAGCGAAADVTVSSSTQPAPPSRGMTDAEFAEKVRAIDYFAGSSESQLRAVGESLCEVFDPSTGGNPAVLWSAAVDSGRSSGLSMEDAGTLVIYSVAAYCPQEFDYLPTA